MNLLEKLPHPAHVYRKVMMFNDDLNENGHTHVVVAYTDSKETNGESEMHIIDSFHDHDRSPDTMRNLVAELNDHITACRRVLGLDTDEFARNGIK